ncbi:YozE family protein [Nitrosopumilus sp. S4]
MPDDKVLTFFEWIMQFVDKEIAYGDLARDMKDDSDLPETNKRDEYEWYFSTIKNCCNDAFFTFHSAFDEYEKYLKSLDETT